MTDRGKRKIARRAFAAWGFYSLASLAGVTFGGLESYQADAVVALHLAVTGGVVPLVLGLFGIDAAAMKFPDKG